MAGTDKGRGYEANRVRDPSRKCAGYGLFTNQNPQYMAFPAVVDIEDRGATKLC
jgi:hypothetical protein